MTQDIDDYIRSCQHCQVEKLPRPKTAGLPRLHPILTSRRLERVEIDFTDLPRDLWLDDVQGKHYNTLLTFIDCHAKFGLAIPARDKLACAWFG
jgi:hypothetical protein